VASVPPGTERTVMDMNAARPTAAYPPNAKPSATARFTRWRLAAAGLVVLGAMSAIALYAAKPEQADVAATPPPMADASRQQLLAERERLTRENAALSARLRGLEAQAGLAEKLDAQATRLAKLAERLEVRLADTEAGAAISPADHAEARLADVQRQLAEARANVELLEAQVAQLEARLKQQQLTVEEAVLRADKAEKLHAALEEAHARVRTENQRLSLELANAKERQAQALQRVLELDTRLEATVARAGTATPVGDWSLQSAKANARGGGGVKKVGNAPAAGGNTVVYEVRAEDTLSRIAAKVYGDASAWQRIFDANRDVLDGPDDLTLGMRLIIP